MSCHVMNGMQAGTKVSIRTYTYIGLSSYTYLYVYVCVYVCTIGWLFRQTHVRKVVSPAMATARPTFVYVSIHLPVMEEKTDRQVKASVSLIMMYGRSIEYSRYWYTRTYGECAALAHASIDPSIHRTTGLWLASIHYISTKVTYLPTHSSSCCKPSPQSVCIQLTHSCTLTYTAQPLTRSA